MAEAIFTAMTRGTPGLARNEFDNLPVSIEELFAALPIVAQQTGLLKKAGAPAGEVQAAEISNSTSMQSSSITAPAQASTGPTI